MKRRGFLGGLAALTASTPGKILKAAGVNASGFTEGRTRAGLLSASAAPDLDPGPPWWAKERMKLAALKALRPGWFEKKRRRAAHHVHTLDIDIAAFRSVSPAAKITIQRERNYRRELEREIEHYELVGEEETFRF